MIELLEYEGNSVFKTSGLISNLLNLSHPLTQQCAFSALNELSASETYVKFSSAADILRTGLAWVREDERVFNNIVEAYTIFTTPVQEPLSPALDGLIQQEATERFHVPTQGSGTDYAKFGFLLGDSIARLALSLGD